MKIGIIGGVSPAAYSKFYNQLCSEYRKLTGYYPEIISYSIKVSRLEEKSFFENDKKNLALLSIKKSITKACKIFKENDVEIVTICCNTLSNIFHKIACQYNFKYIVTPVSSVNEYLKNSNIKYILLSTKYTVDNNLYKNMIKPTQSDQKYIDKFISDKVNNKKNNISIDNIISKYDVDSVLLGCTDINKDDIGKGIRVIDSNECLLNECLKYMVK